MVVGDFKIKVLPVSKKLLRYASHFLRDDDEARDVVQDIFLKLWQKKEELDQIENIEAFAMRMTRNRCLDIIRAGKTVPIDAETNRKLKQETIDVHSKVELSEAAGQVKQLISRLPDIQQKVMHLRDIEQLAAERPDDLVRVPVDPSTGLDDDTARRLVAG